MSKLTELVGGGDNLAMIAALSSMPFLAPMLGSALGAGGASAGGGALSGLLGTAAKGAGGVAKNAGKTLATNAAINAVTPQQQAAPQIPQQQVQIPNIYQSNKLQDNPLEQLLAQFANRNQQQRGF
ncbi:hypothetical protein N9064_00660 [bacterium]|nr:hypothetical protein [bacterium]